jgi:Tfp pilus assembly protein PilP
MRRCLLLCLLMLAACSKGPQADLQYISKARSLAAEWALVNELAAEGKVTAAYVAAMHKSLRQQVQTTAKALTMPDDPYAQEIRAVAGMPDDASPQQLRASSDKLKAIEDSLESA